MEKNFKHGTASLNVRWYIKIILERNKGISFTVNRMRALIERLYNEKYDYKTVSDALDELINYMNINKSVERTGEKKIPAKTYTLN